jgi:hypothetical protein
LHRASNLIRSTIDFENDAHWLGGRIHGAMLTESKRRNIPHVGDVWFWIEDQGDGMQILIEVVGVAPPEGRLRSLEGVAIDAVGNHALPRSDDVVFAGWLGLLRALSTLMGPEEQD